MNTAHRPPDAEPKRNYAMFDAELTGAALNLQLLGRLMQWMKPYRLTFMVSAVLILKTMVLTTPWINYNTTSKI